MRFSTKIYMGIRNIGDAEDSGEVYFGTMKELIEKQILRLSKVTIRKRIEIVFAADQQVVINRLNGTRVQKELTMELMLDEAEALMNNFESTNDTDDAEDD